MSHQHFYDRVATFENLGHRGAVTGWEVYDFVSLEEATRDLPVPSISTRTCIILNLFFFSCGSFSPFSLLASSFSFLLSILTHTMMIN